MKEQYISPELEIWRFLPAERIASSATWQSEEGSSEEIPDVEIPGNKIPGWGN